MELNNVEVAYEIPPFVRVYKDGRIERLLGTDVVPSSIDPKTSVSSKDVIIVPEIGLSARLYLPTITNPQRKLPVLVYFHGGGFCIESAFSPTYHSYLNSLVAEANIVAVSVDYRRAPEHPLPIAYDDSWAALQWVVSHSHGEGPETWLKEHGDFERVFLAGDSAGANIAHNITIRCGETNLVGVKLIGSVLIHPFFWGVEPIGSEASSLDRKRMVDKCWFVVCPSTIGCDDPLINPTTNPKLSNLGCSRVLVCVAGKDLLRDRGWLYYETLAKSGWGGVVEFVEADGENHVFHLLKPTCEKAVNMMKRVSSFINLNIKASL